MYTDECSDKESEYEERSPNDSPSVTKKSLSTVGFRNNPERGCARPLALRGTQSLTAAVDELRLSAGPELRCGAAGPGAGCPCGCTLRPALAAPFRTRDRASLALYVVSPDVLHHHGYDFQPEEIAMFWKKDCRMFLWKGQSKIRNVIRPEPLKK